MNTQQSDQQQNPQHLDEGVYATGARMEEFASLPSPSKIHSPINYNGLPGEHPSINSSRPPEYASVIPPGTDSQCWTIPLPDYLPVPATSADINICASANELSRVVNDSVSYEGSIRISEDGVTQNPIGRTGLTGKGRLYFWGPNHASDPIILNVNESGKLEILLIERDCDQWAFPGGFQDKDELPLMAAFRELGEEAVENIEVLEQDFLNNSSCIFQGYTADGRNTDNAWIETSVFVLTISSEVRESLVLHARSDAKRVAWHRVNDKLLQELYADHGKLLRLAIEANDLDSLIDE